MMLALIRAGPILPAQSRVHWSYFPGRRTMSSDHLLRHPCTEQACFWKTDARQRVQKKTFTSRGHKELYQLRSKSAKST